MKKILSVLVIALISVCAKAQTEIKAKAVLSPSSIIRDTTGKKFLYSYAKFFTGIGDFKVVPVSPDKSDSEFLLLPTTTREKLAVLASMPKPAESTFFTTGQD